jgi:hypothetical protein
MSTHTDHGTSGAAHQHEKTDVNVGFVATSAGGLLAIMFVGIALMFGLYASLQRRWTRLDQPISPLAAKLPPHPPGPRLQEKPAVELGQFRAQEQQRLHTYGWVEPAAGVAHMPIERAIDITLQRGLPVRKAETKSGGQEARK